MEIAVAFTIGLAMGALCVIAGFLTGKGLTNLRNNMTKDKIE